MGLDREDAKWLLSIEDQLEDLAADLEMGVDDLVNQGKIDRDQRSFFESSITSLSDVIIGLDEILSRLS